MPNIKYIEKMKINENNPKEKLSYLTICLCIYFVSLPLGMLNIGAIGSLLKVIGLLPLVGFILDNKFKIKLVPVLIGQLLLVIWAAFSYIWSISQDQTFIRLYSQLLFILLLIPCCSSKFSDKEINYLKESLIWSSRVSLLLVLFLGTTSSGRLLLNGVFAEDPNLLTAYFVFGITYSFTNLLNKNVETKINTKNWSTC